MQTDLKTLVYRTRDEKGNKSAAAGKSEKLTIAIDSIIKKFGKKNVIIAAAVLGAMIVALGTVGAVIGRNTHSKIAAEESAEKTNNNTNASAEVVNNTIASAEMANNNTNAFSEIYGNKKNDTSAGITGADKLHDMPEQFAQKSEAPLICRNLSSAANAATSEDTDLTIKYGLANLNPGSIQHNSVNSNPEKMQHYSANRDYASIKSYVIANAHKGLNEGLLAEEEDDDVITASSFNENVTEGISVSEENTTEEKKASQGNASEDNKASEGNASDDKRASEGNAADDKNSSEGNAADDKNSSEGKAAEDKKENKSDLSEKKSVGHEVSTLELVMNDSMKVDATAEEIEILERIVEAEATGEDVYGRMLVANVIINRMNSRYFANSIEGVVFQKLGGSVQFSPISDGRYYTVKVTDDTKEAVQRVLAGEDYSKGALYFFQRSATTANKASWFDKNLKYLLKYGCHEFYTEFKP